MSRMVAYSNTSKVNPDSCNFSEQSQSIFKNINKETKVKCSFISCSHIGKVIKMEGKSQILDKHMPGIFQMFIFHENTARCMFVFRIKVFVFVFVFFCFVFSLLKGSLLF